LPRFFCFIAVLGEYFSKTFAVKIAVGISKAFGVAFVYTQFLCATGFFAGALWVA